jgi:ATP-binding cassette subfamily B protein
MELFQENKTNVQVKAKGEKPSPIKLLGDLIDLNRKDLIIVIVYAIVMGLLYLIVPLAVQELVNIIAFGVVLQPLFILTALVAFALILVGVFQVIQRYIVELLQQRLFVNNSLEIVKKVKNAKKGTVGQKQINLFFEVISLQKSVSKILIDGLTAVLQAGVGLTLLSFYHPMFTLLSAFLVVGTFLALYFGGKGGIDTSLKESGYKYNLVHWLQEVTAGQDSIKMLDSLDYIVKRTDSMNLNYIESRNNHFKVLIRQRILSFIVLLIANSSLLGLGGWLVINGQLTLGQLIAAEIVVASILAGIDKFVSQNDIIYDMFTALTKLDYLKSTAQPRYCGMREIKDIPNGLNIECKNISFSYSMEGGFQRNIIQGMDLRVPSGDWISINSSIGSGKNTLLNLLAGLLEPNKGIIYLDEVDIKQISDASLGKFVSVIKLDDDYIFEGTLEENILLGRTETLPMKNILQMSLLEAAVHEWPDGLQRKLQSKGTNISESQIARILIARALVTHPRLLLINTDIFSSFEPGLKIELLNSFKENFQFKPTIIFVGNDNDINSLLQAQYSLIDGKLEQIG